MHKQQQNIASKLLTVLFIFLALPATIFLVQHNRLVRSASSSIHYSIYDGSLASGWKAHSWTGRINLANPSPVYTGSSQSISFTPMRRWDSLYLYTNTPVDTSLYSFFHFAAQASQAGQDYSVILYNGPKHVLSRVRLAGYNGDPIPRTWKVYTIPLSDLKATATHISGVAFQSRTRSHGTLYLDSISLIESASSPTSTPIPSATPTLPPTPTLTPTATPLSPTSTPVNGHTYYVSKSGNNSDGLSWATAWNELDQIKWSVIQPGDIILLDGGSNNMVYTTTLYIQKSGTAIAPISIQRATEPGRNGKVVIFGGRSTPLPYCGQPSYANQTSGVISTGITVGGNAWIVIDGMSWDGISIYGHAWDGIELSSNASSNDTFRNLEIYDNGSAEQQSDGSWIPRDRGDGVDVYGSDLIFEQMNIHDNGDDAFEPGPVNNITIRHSWLHETREDPTQPGLPWDQCVHQDGFQIYGNRTPAGALQGNILIEDSILGPGLKEGTILGASSAQYPQVNSVVNNVTIRNTLFTNKVINVMGFSGLKEQNWTLDHVTVFSPNNAIGVWIEGSGHVITNSIFSEGQILLPDGLKAASGNCQWNTNHDTSSLGGQTTDPKFVTDVSSFTASTSLAQIANANFALQSNSPCLGEGSSITSVAQLISTATES